MLEGPALLQNALAARLSLPPTGSHHQALSPPLPEVLSFDLNMPAYASPSSPFSLPPNYVLAVRPPPSSSSSSGASQAGSLLPIHDLIYRATCAHLPPIPVRSPSLPPSALPVISITLPSPSTLPLLNSFLYIQRPDILLSSLLHLPPLPAHATPRTRAELTTYLAQTMDLRALLERIGVVHQVWGNVCALGCADGLLWKALDAGQSAPLPLCCRRRRLSLTSSSSTPSSRSVGSPRRLGRPGPGPRTGSDPRTCRRRPLVPLPNRRPRARHSGRPRLSVRAFHEHHHAPLLLLYAPYAPFDFPAHVSSPSPPSPLPHMSPHPYRPTLVSLPALHS